MMQTRPVRKVRQMWWDLQSWNKLPKQKQCICCAGQQVFPDVWCWRRWSHLLHRVPSIDHLLVYPSWGEPCWLHAALTSSTLPSPTLSTFCCLPFCLPQSKWAMLTACLIDQQHFAFWELPLLSEALKLPVCMAHTVVHFHAKQVGVSHECWQDVDRMTRSADMATCAASVSHFDLPFVF